MKAPANEKRNVEDLEEVTSRLDFGDFDNGSPRPAKKTKAVNPDVEHDDQPGVASPKDEPAVKDDKKSPTPTPPSSPQPKDVIAQEQPSATPSFFRRVGNRIGGLLSSTIKANTEGVDEMYCVLSDSEKDPNSPDVSMGEEGNVGEEGNLAEAEVLEEGIGEEEKDAEEVVPNGAGAIGQHLDGDSIAEEEKDAEAGVPNGAGPIGQQLDGDSIGEEEEDAGEEEGDVEEEEVAVGQDPDFNRVVAEGQAMEIIVEDASEDEDEASDDSADDVAVGGEEVILFTPRTANGTICRRCDPARVPAPYYCCNKHIRQAQDHANGI